MEKISLQVDLKKSDEELNKELNRAIKERCSGFSGVRSVKIHRSPKLFALFEMASLYHALKLASQYGGSAFDTCVLVYLEPISHLA